MIQKWLTKHNKQLRDQNFHFLRNLSITGVCEALGLLSNINPLIFRVAFVLLTIFYSPWIVLVYLGLAVILPTHPQKNTISLEEELREKHPEATTFDICEKCQTAVKQGSIFCHRCGNKL